MKGVNRSQDANVHHPRVLNTVLTGSFQSIHQNLELDQYLRESVASLKKIQVLA